MTPINHNRARRSLLRTRRQAIAATSVILSLLNALIAAIACFIANHGLALPLSYSVAAYVFFVSLETLYAGEIEKRILSSYGHSTAFRLAEFGVLALLLRLLLLATGNEGSRLAAFRASLSSPAAAVFNPEFLAALVLLGLLWGFSLLNLHDMQSIYNLDQRSSWEQIGKDQADLARTRQGFIQRFLFLGLALLAGMFMSVSDWGGEGAAQVQYHGTPPILIGAMLLYYSLVLLLMSQTQLARLRTRWWLNESTVHPQLGKRWVRVSAVFFGMLSLAVLVLPTGFGEDLLAILQVLLLYLASLGQALIALLLLPLALLFPWLNVQTEAIEAAPQPPIASPTPTPTRPLSPAWLGPAGNIVFWVVLGLAIAFAVFQYLRQERSLLQDIRSLFQSIGKWLRMQWLGLVHGWHALQQDQRARRRISGTQSLRSSPAEAAEPRPAAPDAPRLRIFALYRALLAWGAEHGTARRPSQTPLGYQQALEQHLPDNDAIPAVRELTHRFDQARYSREPISDAEAQAVEQDWNRSQQA